MKKNTYFPALFIVILLALFTIETAHCNAGDDSYAVKYIPLELVKDARAIVRNSIESFTVKTEGTAVQKKYRAITILNETGSDYGRIVAHYGKFQKVGKITATLYDANGKAVRKLKKDEVTDMSTSANSSGYDDSRVVTAKMVYDEYPYTIEYEYTVNYRGLMSAPGWYPQYAEDLAVQKSSFIIEAPNSLPLRYHSEDKELQPEIAKQGDATIYTWQVENLKAIEEEPYGPTWRDQMLNVLIAPTDFELDGYAGSMKSWASYGEWHHKLNEGRDDLSSETILKVQELTQEASSIREKAILIYQYLQSHTRYVSIQLGIGGWQTFEASHVEKNSYGDCKALSNYTKAMLKAVGIESNIVLINSGRNASKICKGFCSNQFNHVFLTVPLPTEKDTLWLECTSQQIPPNYMGTHTDDRAALLIDPKGSKIIHTPVSTAKQNIRIRNIEADILDNGGVAAKVNIEYKGIQQDYPRHVAKNYSPRKQKEWLQAVIDLSGVTINEYDFSTVSMDEPLVALEINLTARQYASKAGKRLLINPNLLSRISSAPKKMTHRTQPVVLKRPYSYQDEVHYNIPEGFAIESIPKEPVEIQSEFGTYKAQFFLTEDGQLQYTRFFQENKIHLPPEKYEAFRQFRIEVNKADKTKMVLVKTE